MWRTIVTAGCLAASAALAPLATADERPPEEWIGLAGRVTIPGTYREHPGVRVAGDVLADSSLAFERTGHLASEFTADIAPGGRVTLPVSTPLVYVTWASNLPPFAPGSTDPRAPRGSNFWCALPPSSDAVCMFFWNETGRYYAYPPVHGMLPDAIPNSYDVIPTAVPRPNIVVENVELPRAHSELRLQRVTEAGIVVATVTTEQGAEVTRPAQTVQWGVSAPTQLLRGATFTATPRRNASGAIVGAEIAFERTTK